MKGVISSYSPTMARIRVRFPHRSLPANLSSHLAKQRFWIVGDAVVEYHLDVLNIFDVLCRISAHNQQVRLFPSLNTSSPVLNPKERCAIQRGDAKCLQWRKADFDEILYCLVIGESGYAYTCSSIGPQHQPTTCPHKFHQQTWKWPFFKIGCAKAGGGRSGFAAFHQALFGTRVEQLSSEIGYWLTPIRWREGQHNLLVDKRAE